MKPVFIDCGFHFGEGLKKFVNLYNINKDWEVHCFEANPYCNIDERIKSFSFPIITHPFIVWTSHTFLDFNVYGEVRLPTPWGWSHVGSNVSCLKTNRLTVGKPLRVLSLSAIDFSSFLSSFSGREVYGKMNIEGSEYPVLSSLICTHALSIFKELWVDLHPKNMPYDTSILDQQIKSYSNIRLLSDEYF